MTCNRRRGLGLIEMIILIAVVAILLGILIPMLAQMRKNARVTMSKNNLAILGKAMKHYEALGRGNLKTDRWEETLGPFVEDAKKVVTCPLRDKEPRNGGVYGYALNALNTSFGRHDDGKISIVTSDHRVIDIDTKGCVDGKPVVKGVPVARHGDNTFALHYGGSVHTHRVADVMPDSPKKIVLHWQPWRHHGVVCGKVVVIPLEDDEVDAEANDARSVD